MESQKRGSAAWLLGVVLVFVWGGSNDATAQVCVPPPPGLVSWWTGDGDGTDIVGGHDGTPEHGATFGSGQVGQAFFFDGFDDIVLVPHDDDLAFGVDQDFTIDAWINIQTPTVDKDDEILIKSDVQKFRSGDSPNYYRFHVQRNNYKVRFILSSGGSTTMVESLNSVALNQWHHVAAVREGSEGRIYIDGQLDSSGPVVSGTVANNDPLAIGGVFDTLFPPKNVQGNHTFGGLIDEVEVFGRALLPHEIEALYDAGSAGKCHVVAVSIDIKPGSDPNCFNINGHGVIPVAVLGAPGFDVMDVDTSTLAFDGLVVRVRGNKGPMCHVEDSNGDGFDDLVCQFEDDPANWTGGGAEGVVTGQRYDGNPFEGSDSLCIVP